MKKEPLTHRLWAKIGAYFLLAACIVGMLLSAFGIFFAWEENIYTADLSGLKGAHFRQICIGTGYNLVASAREELFFLAEQQAAGKNAEFRVWDSRGGELWKSEGFDDLADSARRWTLVYGWRESQSVRFAMFLRETDGFPESLAAEEYVVEAAVDESFPFRDELYWTNLGYDLLYGLRYGVYAIAGLSLALGIACFVFLLCGAGRRAGCTELTPGYLYRIPFDLLTAALAAWCALVAWAGHELTYSAVPEALTLLFIAAAVLAVALPAVGWCASLAMRVKLGKWWRNTVIWRLLSLLGRMLRALGRGLAYLLRGLPLVWKTVLLLAAVSLAELLVLFGLGCWYDQGAFLIGWVLERAAVAVGLLWVSLSLRRLQKGGEALAAGDLSYQTDTRYLVWDFRRHGENLNAIGVGMARAVEERLRSERLKTELITNVSHDIKTPLTSIVNYVDLLKSNTDPSKTGEYLEVLDRQSRRLKKLTEDLVEVSKASTGSMEVSLARHSVSELLRQAVGEYSERFTAAGLESVLTLPEQELFALVDGTLLWRVLDNLFSNACKYAQPGTRFYADAGRAGERVELSFKNISRERLNLPAEELLERFVRGDSARGGEGSGLGLNIARSLTELQGGSLALSVDGDLFKVVLSFPAVG